MPTLLLHHPEKGKRWKVEIAKDHFTIGRARDVEVCLPISSVSKKHVLVERKGPRFVFRDLGSKNGVFLNGFRTDHGPLTDGDELRVGSITMTFYRDKAPEDPEDLILKELQSPESLDGLFDESEEKGEAEPFHGAETLMLPSAELAPTPPETEEAPPESPPGAPAAQKRGEAPPRPPRASNPPSAPPPSRPAPSLFDLDEELLDAAEIPLGRQAIPHRQPAPRRSFPRRHQLSTPNLVFLVIACIGAGFALGYLGSIFDSRGGSQGGRAMRNGDEEAEAAEAVESGAPAPEKKIENPLGPPASMSDPETIRRLITRLHLDLVGRPPVREELLELVTLSLEDMWVKVESRSQVSFEREAELDDVFPRFLGRKAELVEKEKLLKLSEGDPKYFAYHVATSGTYAGAAHRRKRSEAQLAGSLWTNLFDAVPSGDDLKKTLEELRQAKDGFAGVAKRLAGAVGKGRGPDATEAPEGWIRDVYSLCLLRLPSGEEEKRALAQLRAEKDGWRQVLLELLSREEYERY